MVNRRQAIKLGAGAALALGTGTRLALGQDDGGDEAATSFVAGLTGGQRTEQVETTAQGGAVFAVTEDGSALEYALLVSGLDNTTMAHIHMGAVGESGEIVVWLYPGPDAREPQPREGTFSGQLAADTITADDFVGPLEGESFDALLSAMRDGRTYVNVHTEQYPAGEIRGQVLGAAAVAATLEGAGGTPTGTPAGNETATETATETAGADGNETTDETPTPGQGGVEY